MTFAATPLVEGFRFLLSRAMTSEKKKSAQEENVIGFFDISRTALSLASPKKKSRSCQVTSLECPIRASQNMQSKTSVFDFLVLSTRSHIADFKEQLSKHLLVKHIATLGPRPQLLESCAPVDCATVWKSARAHRARG